MKILIVKLSAFGDIIHALPALDTLLARPQVREVHWLVDARYRFVCDLFPKHVIIHEVALKGDQPIRSAWRTIRQLKRHQFDAILDLQGLIKSAILARAIGQPVYGIDRSQLREKASALLIQPTPFHAEERHVVQQQMRVAAAPFHHPSEQPIAYTPPRINLATSRVKLDDTLLPRLQLKDTPYVILHSAGGWRTKQLPDRTWLRIAEALRQQQKTPLFTWGNAAEQQHASTLATASGGFVLPERLNMSALCTLFHHADAVVGADTGLLHLAAALQRPTITFWGPSASWRSGPLNSAHDPQGDRNWHIESNPACGPCFKRRCDHFTCMDAIDPAAIIRILKHLPPPSG